MSLSRKILKNTFWQVFGRVTTAIIGIVSIKVITNYLPTDIYGQYTTLYEYIGFFAIAADFGLFTIGVREMAKKEKSESEILANILSIRLILIVLTLGLSILIAQLIPKYADSYISNGIWLVAITTGLMLIHGTLSSVLQYKLKMLWANISLIIAKSLIVGYIITTIFYISPNNIENGFRHLLYAGIIGNSVLILLTIYFVSRHAKIYLDFNWKYTKELVLKSLPLGLSLILSTIYFKIDVVLLSLIRSYHETGIYGVSLKFMEILTVIPVFFMNSALPAITESYNKNLDRFKNLVEQSWQFLLLTATPLLIGGLILAFPITFLISSPQFLSGYHCTNNIQTVYTTQEEAIQNCPSVETRPAFTWDSEESNIYLEGSDIALKLIIIAMFFSFLNTLFAFTLVAMDKQSNLLVINLVGAAFNVITNLTFIPTYGFKGAALTTILSEIIILIGTYYAVKSKVDFKLPIASTIKILVSGLFMGVVVYLLKDPSYKILQNMSILVIVPIGALVYILSIYLLKAIDHDQVKKILKRS